MKHFPTLSLATMLFAATSLTPALALDGNDFADKFAKVVGANGLIVDLGEVSTSGDTVTVSSVSIAPPGEEPIKMDKAIVFTGVAEADGGYTADAAKIEAFTITDDEVEVSIGDILIEDIVVPADAAADPMANITLYGRIISGPTNVKIDGADAFSIKSIEATNRLDASGNVLTGTFALDGLHMDLEKLAGDGAEELAMAQAFGLNTINARMAGENIWQIDTGTLTINKGQIEIDEVGTINVTGEIDGYDKAMVEEVYAIQSEIMANPDADAEEIEEKSEEILALMGEKLSISKMAIRFDDASITGRILGMFAAQSGTTPDVMAAGFAATLPVMASQFGAPEAIQTMLADAGTAFLKDPKNIEISVAPTEPIPFMKSMVVVVDPSALVSLFNLAIKANQ